MPNLSPRLITTLLVFIFALSACPSHHVDQLAKEEPPYSRAMRTYCRLLRTSFPKDFFHGYVTVPENYSAPGGRQIKVFYYGKIFSTLTPVVFFNGGPAASSLVSYALIHQTQQRRSDWSKVPFIFIDQRGTGCSQEFPEADGVRLALYSSKQIVRDAEVIRKKLMGERRWKIFGQSHGAQVVHRYLLDAPQGILSAHAHGNSIGVPDKAMLEMRLRSQNRVLKEYLKRFPSDEDDFQALGRHFTPQKCYSDTKTRRQFCGKIITHQLLFFLGFADRWNSLHEWVNDMSKGGEINESAIQDFIDNVVVDQTGSSSNEGLAALSINKFDYGGEGLDYFICTSLINQLKASGENPDSWPLHECSSSLASTPTAEDTKQLEDWKTFLAPIKNGEITIEEFKLALEKNPEIPFYLYSGELDVFVPKEAFIDQVKTLGPLIKYTHFSGSGHDGYYTEPLVWRNLLKDRP